MELKLASTLKSLRDQKGYSQGYVAFCLEKSDRTYARIEKGASIPLLTEAPKFARIFDLSLVEFILKIFDEKEKDSSVNRDSHKMCKQEIAFLKKRNEQLESENEFLRNLVEKQIITKQATIQSKNGSL